jgi:hypothetical protein
MSMNPVLSIDYIAITVATTVKWGATPDQPNRQKKCESPRRPRIPA